jgi:hypothetical protein
MKLSQIVQASHQQLQMYQDPVRHDMDTTDNVFSDTEEEEGDEESDEEN